MSVSLSEPVVQTACYHCGEACPDPPILAEEKAFCCEGCRSVFEILSGGDMCQYYDLSDQPGIRLSQVPDQEKFAFLDQAEVKKTLLSFAAEDIEQVQLYLPQIHCTSCVWLLENLYQLQPGVLSSRVNFLRREVSVSYDPRMLSLRGLVQLMTQLGYEPEIRLSGQERTSKKHPERRKLALQLGVAGFCFGNIMLLSFPEYLGLEHDWAGAQFAEFFGYLNLLLSIPVLLYSAQAFFKPAFQGLKHRILNLDIPVSLGIFALFFRSAFEIISQTGAGYLDSLAGLVFLLLVGKWVQQRTYDSLSFDRDYRSYFPLTSTVFRSGAESQVLVSELVEGDEILVRNQELIPGDATLVAGEARIDYSFVSGESAPVQQAVGDYLYAGGRQVGPAIRIRLEKAVSQSYLTQLWEQDAFQTSSKAQLLVDRLSRWFTLGVLSIASLSALYWWWTAGIGEAVLVGTAVLIVACPCGLALTSPFIFGNAMRILGRHGWYLKNAHVLERLATLTTLVFDKTGTMTEAQEDLTVNLTGELTVAQQGAFAALAYQSSHPMSKLLYQHLGNRDRLEVEAFEEIPGQGIKGRIQGLQYWIGKFEYVFPAGQSPPPSGTWLRSEDGASACFLSEQKLRDGLSKSLEGLQDHYQLVVLSGDRPERQAAIASAVPAGTPLIFGQSPVEKLAFIQERQAQGERVAMLGDGLNDAGALQQSEVGIAITESADAFSPACDLIMEGKALPRLESFLQFSRSSLRLVRIGWLISLTYNLVGLGFAVQGLLTPLVAAILMPLSSLNILAFGLISTQLAANRFLPGDKSHSLL